MAVKQEGKVNVWLFVFPPPLLHFPTAHLAEAAKERDAYVKGRGLWVSLTHPQELLRMKEGKKKPLGRKWSFNFVIMGKGKE